jgi:3-oxoacyl-[acyl-carrier-protein] synthase II
LRPDAIARIASAIGQEFQLTGPRLTLSAACASGLHALIRAALMLRSGEADRALVVASESSLHPLFQATFKRLGVLASPDLGCRPFDQSRDGFLLSESAAAVCLEAVKRSAADHSEGENANRIYVERFALGGDATHLTSSDPTGSTLRRLLQTVINDRPLDLVHAHGTATVANDEIEIAAIESCIPSGCSPALYSHKGALGHSLGAAGLVSIVINCISHRFGVIPPNVQTRTPLPTRNTVLSTSALRRPVRRSIAIAAGFGGPVAVVGLYAA